MFLFSFFFSLTFSDCHFFVWYKPLHNAHTPDVQKKSHLHSPPGFLAWNLAIASSASLLTSLTMLKVSLYKRVLNKMKSKLIWNYWAISGLPVRKGKKCQHNRKNYKKTKHQQRSKKTKQNKTKKQNIRFHDSSKKTLHMHLVNRKPEQI